MSRNNNSLAFALQNAQAIRKILQAFLRGGWKAAALETVKRYWPYVLGTAAVLILIPTIIIASLPSAVHCPEIAVEEEKNADAQVERGLNAEIACADGDHLRGIPAHKGGHEPGRQQADQTADDQAEEDHPEHGPMGAGADEVPFFRTVVLGHEG